jgi:leader peptidase (prepilin peptidase)/N-methyltransferase
MPPSPSASRTRCHCCSADDWPSIRAAFETFLRQSAVADLLADLTHAAQDAAWARQAASTSSIIDMVLGDGVASAWLELPDGIRRHGRVEGYALLVVHVEPRGADGTPAPPASPSSWRRRFERALQLPAAFASLLSGELGLATSGEPPAQAGIRLEAPRDMTDLVDTTGLAALPGAQRLSQFMAYLTACPDGGSAASFYLALSVIRPGGIGLGDAKLAASVGAALGWISWQALFTGTFAAFALAAVYGGTLLALHRATRTSHLPLGPFILIGTLAAIAL